MQEKIKFEILRETEGFEVKSVLRNMKVEVATLPWSLKQNLRVLCNQCKLISEHS